RLVPRGCMRRAMTLCTPPYAELHCHSAYSFLDGVSLPQELARRASELGYGAVALTDHNSLSGSMEMAQAAEEHGVRAMHGAEIDVAVDPPAAGAHSAIEGGAGAGVAGAERGEGGAGSRHITLLVRDGRGWSNLCRIITLAQAHTREGDRRRRRGEPSVALQAVLDHAEGLVCLTGCAGRSVIGHGVHDEPTARRLLDAFGPEGLRVELQRPYARPDRARNRALLALGRRLGLACVGRGKLPTHPPYRTQPPD